MDKNSTTLGQNIISYGKISDNTWILYPREYETVYNKIMQNSCLLCELVGSKNIFNGIQTSRNDYFVFIPTKDDNNYLFLLKIIKNIRLKNQLCDLIMKRLKPSL